MVTLSLPFPVLMVLMALVVDALTISAPEPVVIICWPVVEVAFTTTAFVLVLVMVCAPSADVAFTSTRFTPLPIPSPIVCAPAPVVVAKTDLRPTPVIFSAPAPEVAVTVVAPEPVTMFCAPAMDIVSRVAIPVNVVMAMLITPAPDVSVVRFTPAINAVLKLVPVVMVCAPSPVVLITIFSILLRLVQRASGGAITPA